MTTKPRSSLTILFVIVFVDLLGFGMVIPVMPLYARELGASEAWTGLLSTGYSAMQFLFAPLWGRLSDRIGRRPVLLLSIAVTAGAFTIYGLAGSFAVLLASRLIAGAGTANIAIAQAYVADVTPPEGRARGMGLIGAAFGLGFVLGPALGGLLATRGLGVPGLAAAALAAANGVAAYLVLPEPAARSRVARARGQLAALAGALGRPGLRRLIALNFLVVLAFSAMEATFAFLLGDRYGLDREHVPWVFAFIGVIIVVVQGGLIGPLTRRLGEARVFLLGAIALALGLAALPLAHGLPGLLGAAALLSGGQGLIAPALSALLSRRSRAEEQGGTLGIGQSASALGRIAGPESGTWAWSNLGHAVPYLAGAGIMAVAAAVGATLRAPAPVAGLAEERR